MSVWSGLKRRLFAHRVNERDAPADTGVAATRETGGAETDRTGDARSTTGTGPSDEFVGRVAGDDEGYTDTTGAEARSERGDED